MRAPKSRLPAANRPTAKQSSPKSRPPAVLRFSFGPIWRKSQVSPASSTASSESMAGSIAHTPLTTKRIIAGADGSETHHYAPLGSIPLRRPAEQKAQLQPSGGGMGRQRNVRLVVY